MNNTIKTNVTEMTTTMEIVPGPVIFSYFGTLLNWICPEEIPFDLVRELIHRNLTLIDFATNVLRIETGIIVLMVIFALVSALPCLITCSWCCSKKSHVNEHKRKERDDTQIAALTGRRQGSIVVLWIIFIIISLLTACIIYTNSRVASNVEMTPDMVQSTVHDLEHFLRDTHLQIKERLKNGLHFSVERVIKDLDDIDVLLGVPIQSEISSNTGLELAFDSLTAITLANTELVYRVLMLQETITRALKLAQEAATRMEELQIQLSVLQRQCTYRDRPLCDTLRIRSFEENGVIDMLTTEDQSIFRLRYLGELENGSSVKNLSAELGIARSIFGNFPQQVKKDTSYQRNNTYDQLTSMRHRTTINAQMLTTTINAILNRLPGTWTTLAPNYEILQKWSNTYFTFGWIVAVIICAVLVLVIMAYCCNFCESQKPAAAVFIMATVIVCLSSFMITAFGVFTLAVGGNAEIFLCRALYDKGNNDERMRFEMLGKLLDKPGYIYAHEPEVGIIGELLRPERVDRLFVNVTLSSVLRDCEENQDSYTVFQLDAFVNTIQISDFKKFSKVITAIDDIIVADRTFFSLTQNIQDILEHMLQTSAFNLTTYRASISVPTPEKDLATFIDQMQRVALQIQDVATSSRMATLGSRAKRLQSSIMQPLERLQNEIMYHLTALELQRNPWTKHVNQTLNHLRNIQSYMESTVGEICQNETRHYTDRLKSYLMNSTTTMADQLSDASTKCYRFFEIYDANRIFLCRNIVDNLNTLWFCTLIILLLWSVTTSVGLNIIVLHRKIEAMKKAPARSNRSRRSESRHSPPDQDRRRERSTTRDRPVSGQQRPPLKRTVTEETFDMDDDEADSTEMRESSTERQTMENERNQERNQERHGWKYENMTTPPTAKRNTSKLQKLGGEAVVKWGSFHAKQMANEKNRKQQSQTSKPKLRKQGTEELDVTSLDMWDASPSSTQPESTREQRQFSREHSREGNRSKLQSHAHDRHRSMTPVLKASPDAQAATPLARTPTRLRNRMSLTTRAVADIVKSNNINVRQRPPFKRTNTEEFDLEEFDNPSTTGRSTNAFANVRRQSPPSTAPPPPPPPLPGHRFF